MKIFFPVEVFYPSQAGGAANSVYWLAKHLAEKGVEPTVVATDKGINSGVVLNKWVRSEAGRIIYIKTRSLHFPLTQTITSISNFANADVVHLSSLFFPTAFITGFAARLLRKKIVWSVRGELGEVSLNYSRGRKRPILWLIKKLIGNYPLFHSTSDDETAYIKGIFGNAARVSQIPNYIEAAPLAVREPGNYLLYLGRFHPIKAVDNLLRGIAISEEFLDSEFILKIAGRGKPDQADKLKALTVELGLEKKVEFVGHVEGSAKSKLLADAYFTILPSHSESFGVVVVESLAQNTPVVASTNTPWSSLERERVGICTGNSPAGLAQTIDRILRMDPDEYSGYRARSREYVIRDFDIRTNIEEWLELYRSV